MTALEPLVRLELPVRAAYDPAVDEVPWPVWRLTSPVTHPDVRIGADLALSEADLPVPVWLLSTEHAVLLHPRDPAAWLPTVIVGILLLPPAGAGYPPTNGGEPA